jgi:hypothetical protein
MDDIIGSFRLGEDIAVALDVVSGSAAAVTAVAATMKPARPLANRLVLDDAAPGVALTVTAQGTTGWLITLPFAASAALAPGLYGIDARLTFAGGVEITEQSGFIALSRAAVA